MDFIDVTKLPMKVIMKLYYLTRIEVKQELTGYRFPLISKQVWKRHDGRYQYQFDRYNENPTIFNTEEDLIEWMIKEVL